MSAFRSIQKNHSSGSDSDSDWEASGSKKLRDNEHAQPKAGPRKNNTVWTNALAEENLTQQFGEKAGVYGKVPRVPRASESYPVPKEKAQHPSRRPQKSSDEERKAKMDDELDDYAAEMKEKVGKKAEKREADDPFANDYSEAPVEELGAGKAEKLHRKRNHGGRFQTHYHKGGKKGVQLFIPKHIKSPEDLSDAELVAIIAQNLKEPKTELIARVVGAIGRDLSLELYEDTVKKQKEGGLRTLQGDRLRTAGGTFLFLIRGHESVTAAQKEAIFLEEKQVNRKKARAKRKEKRVLSFAEQLEEVKRLRAQEKEKELPDKKDVILQELVEAEAEEEESMDS